MIKIFPIYVYNLMILAVFISYFKFSSFNWVLKDVGVGLFLIYFFTKIKPVKLEFPSRGFVMMYIIMILLIASHFIVYGFNLVALISIRFLFVYLLLILAGFNLGKYFTEKNMFYLIYIIYWFITIIGVIEIISPDFVRGYSVGDDIYRLYRSGQGYGLGSIFGDRVIFGFVLTYFLVIGHVFIKSKNKLLLFQALVFSLVVLTLSKTAIFTSAIIIAIDVINYLKSSKKESNILVKLIFILFLFLVILFFTFEAQNIIEPLMSSINSANFTTLSGRTDSWSRLDFSLLPNFYYIGSSSLLDINAEVVVDNAFLRIVTNFGALIIIPIVIIVFELLRNWRNINEILKYTFLIILLYSVTVDFYHIVIVVVPMWFSIGFYMYTLKNNKKKKRMTN